MIEKIFAFLLSLLMLVMIQVPVKADDSITNINASQLFEVNCGGCHPQGGNIIRRGKTLKQNALKKYKMDSLEAITEMITHGKGNMSAYGDRLTESEIQALAFYVLDQAENNWQPVK